VTSPTAQIFFSSTWEDLQPERKALEAVSQRIHGVKFVGMEYFGSRDETTQHASLDEVDRSDLYIGIFAGRYGSGITEAEYRRAREKGLTCHIYFKAESSITLDKAEKEQKQRSLLDKLKAKLRQAHTVTEFASPAELAAIVTNDLYRWLNKEWLPENPPEEAVPTINALHQLPSPPRDFTGREEELDELMRALEQGGVTISGLQGLGGVGKTTLALKLAQQLTPRYPDAQFYLDLKGTSKPPLSAADAMAHVIRAYQPTARLPEGEVELSAIYRSVLHNQRALLLMDNAADHNQVEPLIPPESCVMLVTSRQHFTLPGLFTKSLDTLPAEDARKLLLKIAPRINEQADTIAKLCGYLPLALRLAASALAERIDLGVADYVRRLTDAKQRLKLIDASLSLSYDLLSAEMQEGWRVLAIFPDTFDSAAATAVWEIEADAAQDTLSELVKYSLLEWDDVVARYRLHDLARLFADASLSEAEQDEGQRRHALHYVSLLREADELYMQGGETIKRGLILFDLEWPNIQAGQAWAEKYASEDDLAASLCNYYPGAGSDLLGLRQDPREQIRWLNSALAAAQRLKNRPAEGMHLGNLGTVYAQLGETRYAIEFYERYLAIARELSDRRGESYAQGNMGIAYADLGELHRAIELFEQVLNIAQEMNDRRSESKALGNIGIAYTDLGEPRRAISLHEQALVIDREIGDRRSEGQDLGNLGRAYGKLGETHRAIEYYEQRLVIAREIGDRRGESIALWNMSLALDRIGNRDEAIVHAEAALEILEQIEHPGVAEVREQLAEWRGQGNNGGVAG
jgi:tetratricopeptide (TPR) repeat protein